MANPLTLMFPVAEGVSLKDIATTIESNQESVNKALAAVGTVHFARFVLFDRSTPNLQPNLSGNGPFVLGVITEYDGDFTVYIQDFINQLGDVFGALLAFTPDGQKILPVTEHVQEFTEYVALNDASQHAPNAGRLYSAYQSTVQQILAYEE